MEKGMEFEEKNLINIELTQGKELANQLKTHLESTKKSGETCEFLVERILSSYEKALSVLESRALILEEQLPVTSMLESPHSFTSDSPRSEISDQSHKNVFKKRKALPQWCEQVQVSLGTGVEGPLGDGYSWRKYGQKDILGARFPRAYYRCTHRHAQGCLATKQVQKSQENPSLLEVTYRGRHTCHQAALVSHGKRQKKENYETENENKIRKQTEEKFINIEKGLKTEEMDRLPSFSFPSNPIESENVENHFFSVDLGGNNFMGSYSPPFITLETSETNYFSLSPCSSHLNNFEFAQNLQSSESDLTEILSAPNSVTNSPMVDFDISLDQVDFDPNFHLDILEFLL